MHQPSTDYRPRGRRQLPEQPVEFFNGLNTYEAMEVVSAMMKFEKMSPDAQETIMALASFFMHLDETGHIPPST